MRLVEGVAGALLVVAILFDVFQSVIVPRAVGRRYRLSAYLVGPAWRIWRSYALRFDDEERREDFLATYAPLMLLVLLGMWVAGLVLGYGTILYAVREQLHPPPTFGSALYFAGTTLLTIGFGDIVPAGAFAKVIAVVAAATGLAVLALTAAFLFQVFATFQERELFIVTFGTRAGSPPSGVTLLETYAKLDILSDLAGVFEEGQRWSARVLESHMAYPILSYFRSSHDYESWLGALGALLDASTLVLTTLDGVPAGHAKLMSLMGRHATGDLGRYYHFTAGSAVGVDRAEFDAARERLQAAGFALKDPDDAWRQFSEVRSAYATTLNAMAQWWRIPPAQWIGDRSLLVREHAVAT